MKVNISWLKELVDLKINAEELVRLLPFRTIGIKEITKDYIEMDMKGYNRADLLSLRGIAYEVAAITDSIVRFKDEEPDFPKSGKVNIEIADEDLCPVYCVAKIENLKVENSNDTWVKKLNNSGIRTVNNIADITNLVMLEFGQPMHAFDAKIVDKETIIVRTAKEGEKLITLDGKERILTTEDLLITDPKKAIGLAGVMGGKNTEVTDSTTTILLEAAIFEPKTLRKTTTKLGLISEASRRFYHGLTKRRLLQALSAAIKMYESLGGKLTAITITGDLRDKVKTIKISQEKVDSLIGINIPPAEVEFSLKKLGFSLALQGDAWEARVPYWRLDVSIEEDVIEEIARMHGYEKIPAKPLGGNIPIITQNPIFDLIETLKKALSDLGLTEVQTYSYYSTETINNLGLIENNLIRIVNPISSETEYLKNMLWPNLVEVVAKNLRQGYNDIATFEIGKVYYPKNNLPEEEYHLSIALSNNTDNPIQELNQIAKSADLHLEDEIKKEQYFHPKRQTGPMAEVHKKVTDKFGINQRVAILEINLTKLL